MSFSVTYMDADRILVPLPYMLNVITHIFSPINFVVLTKPCTTELRMLYFTTLLLNKIEKMKMAGTSREISSAMDENHVEY